MPSPPDPRLSRRAVLAGMGALAVGTWFGSREWHRRRQPPARVTTLRVPDYDRDLVDPILRAVREYPDVVARAKGGRVVLKPNLVEYDPSRPVNTDPRFVAAVAEVFRRLGVRDLLVAEGPGHRRDTELMVEQSGLGRALSDVGVPFFDLNIDPGRAIAMPHSARPDQNVPVAATILDADLVVSLPKMKTHHWAGATLSMKNLFGTVPGVAVGWPKNPLHWAGIDNAIVDLWLAIRPGFAIVDGIVGMEGDGPIRGEAVPMGVVVVGDQLPAVDATCARLMGLSPEKMTYLALASRAGGTVDAGRITVTGDPVAPRPFAVLPDFEALRGG